MTPTFFRGQWLAAGHPEYDVAARMWNRRVDAHPEVIARCAGTADVVSALAFARERGLSVDVRCTGVTFGAAVARGVVIDLSLMRAVSILPTRRVARVQGGVRGGDLQIEAATHGLAGVTGLLSMTGVGGWLAGGLSYLGPRVGYASDNILRFEMVTADGKVIVASPDDNADLFWAVRGSTGNFGVVTAVEVQLHDVPPVVHGGMLSWPLDDLEAPIRALRHWDWASDHLSLVGILSSASLEGRGGLDLVVCHSGPPAEARSDLDRLRSFGTPAVDGVTTLPLRDLTFAFDDGYPSMRAAIDEQPVEAFDDELVDALVQKVREPAGAGARFVELVPRKGALGRAPALPSALRETGEPPTWGIGPGGLWDDEAEDVAHDNWIQAVMSTVCEIAPVNDRAHPGSVGVTRDVDGVRRMYGDRYDRLRRLKRDWDPGNVFTGSHNIPPA